MNIDRAIVEQEKLQPIQEKQPGATVVTVAYNTDEKLLAENLNALRHQSTANFEVIVVDNSDKKNLEPMVSRFPVNYIKLKENAGLSIARNVGIAHARAEIVIFLDDDAIPARNLVEEHINAYKNYNIAGLRGKALPRTDTVYNYLAATYDLGDKVFPHYINLEGNSSFKKEILNQVGGFYSRIKGAGGYEGAELSYRIVNHLNDRNRLIYYPGAVIYHDYCASFVKYFRKRKRHLYYQERLTEKFPDFFDFMESYQLPEDIKNPGKYPVFIMHRLWLIRKSASFLLKLNKKFLQGVQGGSFFKKRPPGRRRQ
jgi:YD repeat-containing protein